MVAKFLDHNKMSTTTASMTRTAKKARVLGGVYMTPGRLSPRSEFTPVSSHGSIFVYMIPPQNVMPARVTPVLVPGREFHSGTKSRNGIM